MYMYIHTCTLCTVHAHGTRSRSGYLVQQKHLFGCCCVGLSDVVTAGSTDAPHNLCRSPERILNPASEV
ncbi:hypothetical protein I7I48_03431 [Histoplasma ohiense]|nr:hypothetical protein I7I48_03431 [Histoplasma ohiense (nom. inval.)]